ncbi:hypothetical protein [Aquimarina sp. 2201CG14-23]|uniref:hypothetical protein n=1 Tax=Aquimarina mycalae TaxID=3040073 RepID=UPI0024780920|nr:hypothetical protein [Aquimarina sp. 2201CG14-23]MDH7448409.1 hypothetical protein [Aquimarina sp. 2201CG14-23]
MNSDKLTYLKRVLEHKLSILDFEEKITKYDRQLGKILQTPADEYSNSGNIEYGIDNILDAVSAVNYPLGYLRSKRDTYQEILELFEKEEKELESILIPLPNQDNLDDLLLDGLDLLDEEPSEKHFFDCKLTDEDWGAEGCACPGAYVYRKYLSIGLSEEDAKLISNYVDFGSVMEEQERTKAEELYQHHKFLNIK